MSKGQFPISEDEIATVRSILERLKPGLLPFEIFHQVARLSVMPIVEVVPLRRNNSVTEVLLLKREQDDPVWANKLHTPGTVLRATDEPGSHKSAFNRILLKELQGLPVLGPVFVTNYFHIQGRGMEASAIYWVECRGVPVIGTFYPAESLPLEIVESQRSFIAAAVRHFEHTEATQVEG